MNGRIRQRKVSVQPGLDCLEGRELLSTVGAPKVVEVQVAGHFAPPEAGTQVSVKRPSVNYVSRGESLPNM